jgi:hypothetical protein
MRDELGDSRPESGRPPPVPPWSPQRAGAQPGPSSNSTSRWSPGAGEDARPRRGSRRGARLLLWAGLLVALAGLVVSAGAAAIQFLPRHFSAAQRGQIMAWEVGTRWRSWPAGRIFPAAIGYELPGSAFGGGRSLALQAQRVGIARQASCRDATARTAGRLLVKRGCVAVLRATYQDTTHTFAVTVGVAVLPATAAAGTPAAKAAVALRKSGGPPPWLRAVSFRHTVTAHFAGRGHKVAWSHAAGPYLVLATVGFADGRPWLSQGHDTYTRAELTSLAAGVGRSVAGRLGAPPPVPHCPGSPGC